ncbi:MAG TPA: NADH-quinone oxidoreductase subunit NuoH [Verrucomicrobiae bacterium]|nr:NADH-quinone oxidoreductase subunit NuoH [Verrucomicrobiae bacterium]
MDWLALGITVLKSAVVIGAAMGVVAYSVLAERKVSALIQERVGPNRVGLPFIGLGRSIGLGQPIADAFKLILKEQFTPAHVNRLYFWIAPVLAVVPPLLVLGLIPFGSVLDLRPLGIDLSISCVVADIDVGLLLALAVASLSVYGIVIAGWASNSKYPLLGALRCSAQLISYEVSLALSVIPVLLVTGSLNLTEIVEYQKVAGWLALPVFADGWSAASFALWIPMGISFLIFLVSTFAETNRLPFDLPESETELVGGYHTEYSGIRFAMFFLGEYVALVAASALAVTLFFGGWSLPGLGFPLLPAGDGNLTAGLANIAVFAAKAAAFIFFFMAIRWTLPRFRYDQLMRLGWKVFLPLSIANVLLTAVIIALVERR